VDNITVDERLQQAYAVEKLIHSQGWQILVSHWAKLRDKLIEELETAPSEGKYKYFQGQLRGIRMAMKIGEELVTDAKQEQDDLKEEAVYGSRSGD